MDLQHGDGTISMEYIFDESSRVLLEMTSDVETIKTKFGESSRLWKAKEWQLRVLIKMQEMAANEVNHLREQLRLANINQQAMVMANDGLVESMAAGIHTDYLMKANG